MESRRYNIIFGIVFGAITLFAFIYQVLDKNAESNDIQKEFITVSINTRLDNVVAIKHEFPDFRYLASTVYVTFDNSKKYMISTKLNQDYKNKGLTENIDKGDRVIKNPKSDTVYIQKKGSSNTRKYFILK